MKKEKRFYWLKLSENIFDEHPIVFNLPGGNDAFRLYIELCLKSINSNGVLFFSKKISIFSSLSAMTKIDEKIVKQSLKLLIKFDLIIKKEAFILEIKNFSSMIGSVSKDAIRKRKHREKRKNKDLSLLNEKSMVDNVPLLKDNVRDVSQNCPTICPTDLERGKENIRDKEIETRDRYNEAEASLDAEAKASARNEIKKKINKRNFSILDAVKILKDDHLIDTDTRTIKEVKDFMKLYSDKFPTSELFQEFFFDEIYSKAIKSRPKDFVKFLSQIYSYFCTHLDEYEVGLKIIKHEKEIIKIAQTPWVDNDDED